jgi:hypothetical protein
VELRAQETERLGQPGAAGPGPAAPIGPRGHYGVLGRGLPRPERLAAPSPADPSSASHDPFPVTASPELPVRAAGGAAGRTRQETPPRPPAGRNRAATDPGTARPRTARPRKSCGLCGRLCPLRRFFALKNPAPGYTTTGIAWSQLPGSGAVALRLPFRRFGVQGLHHQGTCPAGSGALGKPPGMRVGGRRPAATADTLKTARSCGYPEPGHRRSVSTEVPAPNNPHARAGCGRPRRSGPRWHGQFLARPTPRSLSDGPTIGLARWPGHARHDGHGRAADAAARGGQRGWGRPGWRPAAIRQRRWHEPT